MIKFTLLKRLTLGYLAVLILVIFLGMYVAFNLNHLNRLILGTAADGTTLTQLEQLRNTLFSQVSFEKKYLISKDADFIRKFWEIRDLFLKDLELGEYRMDTSDKRTLFDETKDMYSRYVTLFAQQTERVKKGQSVPGPGYGTSNEQTLDAITQRLNRLIAIVESERRQKLVLSGEISARVLRMTLITGILTVVVGTLISVFNTRKINRSIVLLQKKSREIAQGNYVEIPPIDAPTEIADLADDFNRMSRQLKELDEMKIDFINHVSHELRTPLTAIKEASEMLLEGTYAAEAEKQQLLLSITKEECERLIASVNRLLDFSRMEAHMMEYRFQKCQLEPIIRRAILKLAPIARSKCISLELKPLQALPPVVADQERIGQVLENLIGNALKFTADNGQVTVRAEAFCNKKPLVCVAVADTGIGIDESHLCVIFNKFSRFATDVPAATGSGLGLTIAKHIVEDHGGEIWARSTPAKGSTFYFVLPVA